MGFIYGITFIFQGNLPKTNFPKILTKSQSGSWACVPLVYTHAEMSRWTWTYEAPECYPKPEKLSRAAKAV